MEISKKNYISPFSTRYASEEMQEIFSESFKFRTWRRLWIALAKAEKSWDWKLPTNRSRNSKRIRTISISGTRRRAKRSCGTT